MVLATGLPAVGGFIAVRWRELVLTVAHVTAPRSALAVLALLLILEAIRRAIGWSVVILVACFILYAHFAGIFTGFLRSQDQPWYDLVNYLYLDTGALLSMVRRGATIGLAVILSAMGQSIRLPGDTGGVCPFCSELPASPATHDRRYIHYDPVQYPVPD